MKPTKVLLPLLFGSLLSQQAAAIPNTGSANHFNKPTSLHFIENKGQITDQHNNPRTDIDFKIPAGNGLNIFVGTGKIHYQWSKTANNENREADNTGSLLTPHSSRLIMYRMDVTLLNANPSAEIVTEEKQSYYEQYYVPHTGPDGATARTYRKITYREVYPNIDWVFRINDQGKLEHDFIVRPGGKVSDIRLQYAGADSIRCSSDGSITAVTPFGVVTESTPYCFLENGTPVSGKFILENNILGFATAAHQGTLIIDPVLEWATYFGGTSEEQINDITTHSNRNIYVTGFTSSNNNIATTGSFKSTYSGNGSDAFIAAFNVQGVCLWSTYYGYDGNDKGCGIKCDPWGNIYISGTTGSKSGFTTTGSHQETHGGGATDAFLVKFDESGRRIWSTYYGGSRTETEPGKISCDKWGNLYLSGASTSTNNISTSGSHQETKQGTATTHDAFLVKFDTSGSRIWGTYFGGGSQDYGHDVACDPNGNIFLFGRTNSTAIPGITGTAHQPSIGGAYDVFIAKFDSAGNCSWGSYYGGAGEEYVTASGICDNLEYVYLTGTTVSTDGISSPGSYQTTSGGSVDAFLAKFDTTGNRLWGTYYGSPTYDYGLSVACDGIGNIYLSGYTNGSTGIASSDGLQSVIGGMNDAYMVKFDSSGQRIWGTYFGSTHDEFNAIRICTDAFGHIYVSGTTESISDISTPGAHQQTIGGGYDGFLVRIGDCNLDEPDTVLGPLFVCPEELGIYHVTPIPGAISYTWALPSGWTGSSTTDSIWIKAGNHSDTIRVSAHTFCGTTPERLLVVSVSPGATISTTSTSLCAGDSILFYASTYPDISWQWLFNNTAIVGTDSILLAWQRGSYRLLTTMGHCTDTSDPLIIHSLPLPRMTQNGNILSTENHFISYQWYYGTQSITGATQSSYNYSAEGNYSVKVTDSNGCTGISEPFTPVHVAVLGDINSIRIYPNPANSVIHITAASPVSATITAMDGREILHTKQTDRINIRTLPDGLYLLQVKDNKGHTIHKEKMVKSSF